MDEVLVLTYHDTSVGFVGASCEATASVQRRARGLLCVHQVFVCQNAKQNLFPHTGLHK